MVAVTLINCFEVPPDREEEFWGRWKEVNAYMQTKPGYLGHELHRALAPDAAFRFVNVAQWASAEHFHAAHDTGFRALVDQPVWSAFQHHPVLYEVVHGGHAGTCSAGA